MKVAIDVTPILPGGEGGGVKQLLFELLRGLSKQAPGDSFVLLTSCRNHDIFREFEMAGMERVMVLKDRPAEGIRFWPAISLFLNRFLSRTQNNSYSLRKNNVSVLFCPLTATTYAEPGIPTVSVINDLQHCYYPFFFSHTELNHRNDFYNDVKKKANHIITISEYTKWTVIEKLGISPEKITSIYNCTHERFDVHQDSTKTLAKYHLSSKRYLFYPANLWPHKNHQLLLLAFNVFRRKHPESDLHLVFTGAEIENTPLLKDAVERMDLTDNVAFLGYLNEEELGSIWLGAFALIFPSLFEGFGIPLVEAMKFEKPILASNVTSIPEVAGDAALYFDPRKPDEIITAMEMLVFDQKVHADLVAKGKDQLEKFNDEAVINAYLSVLRNAAASATPGSYLDVSGIYSDGWAGEAIRIDHGASTGNIIVEVSASIPPFRTRNASKITVTFPDGRKKLFQPQDGGKFYIKEALPQQPGTTTLAISGGFVPGNGDTRKLTLRISDFSIFAERNGAKLYEYRNK